MVVPYGASHIETAERVTHIMRKTKNETEEATGSGFYRDIDLGDPQAYHTDIEERKAEEGGYSIQTMTAMLYMRYTQIWLSKRR